ncbi:hypothetical protein NW110_03710 [Staphylococcus pettenkoferi]|uniref:hypothetical protein n=1 Tax=Staphylococcus pettenkoferi TaxID=170573 RepID=UPI00119E6FE6|nr:hypothetical protein [Staphylococcus pettenkoferi]MCY1590274.1 hypothetical protein [Staphylococcus pettenkoferi]MCY1600323.1 hypothetical protein [Staphylococcus pettenkoferi]MCY1601990.1 hypothetical protein [Staphylococcus pettenkoferi]MCY1608412.1 hypothetical protein [Staphylococcus pettenkoferi]MCY1613207.1 hypothetical protein [Staphylococcus pettenkoferi]
MNFNSVIKYYALWKFGVWIIGLGLLGCSAIFLPHSISIIIAIVFLLSMTALNFIKVRWNLSQGHLRLSSGSAYILLFLTSVLYGLLLGPFIYYVGRDEDSPILYLTALVTFVIVILEYILKVSANLSDVIQVKMISSQQAKRWLGSILIILGASLIAILIGVYYTNWATITISTIIFVSFTFVLVYYLRKYQVED